MTVKSLLCTIGTASLTLPVTLAHMEMSWPYPIRSKFDPANDYSIKDYDMVAPLNADGFDFPCKGYHTDPSRHVVAWYTAGQQYNMSLAGTARHGGGSCQLSLSYDDGKTFHVIKSMVGDCPTQSSDSSPVDYDFSIPAYAPSGTALLAWTWQNLIGNREFYMNCALIQISSDQKVRRARRQNRKRFGELPSIWIGNLRAINTCKTVEGSETIYPHPGPDVVYGNSVDLHGPVTAGDCDDGSLSSSGSMSGNVLSDVALVVSSQTTIKHTAESRISGDSSSLKIAVASGQLNRIHQVSAASTTTVTVNCSPSVSTVVVTATVVVPTATSASGPSSQPAYADASTLDQYLPCVPGTFICTSVTAWYTCTSDAEGIDAYQYQRGVAAGMMCLTNLSPYDGTTSSFGQQALTPTGSYRDDRIVRARPHGDCDEPGAILCTDQGTSFEICDQGGWVRMGSVASGTMCQNGEITVAS